MRFDRKNIDSLLKQETEINQICNFTETSDDDDEADDGEGMTEIRFAPDDKATLQVMFSSMSHCQTLHPDPEAAEDAADEEAENDEVRFPAMFCFCFFSLNVRLWILFILIKFEKVLEMGPNVGNSCHFFWKFQLFFIPEVETPEQTLSYIDFHFLDMYNVFHIIAGPMTGQSLQFLSLQYEFFCLLNK